MITETHKPEGTGSFHRKQPPRGSSHMQMWSGHWQTFLISQGKLEHWICIGNLPTLEMLTN